MTGSFKVGYLEHALNRAFVAAVKSEPVIELVSFANDAPDAAAKLDGCQAYYVSSSRGELPGAWHVTEEFLARFRSVVLVVSRGAGFDTVDVKACTRAGVPVINQAGGNASGVAEHALGMMLVLLKRIPEGTAVLRAGHARDRNALMGRELTGRTVGFVGLGHTGGKTAQLVKAFSCRLLAFDPYLDRATVSERGAEKVEFAELLKESEIVSVHCPRNAETIGMFGREQFRQMRAGAIFITTARGGIHDETSLYGALTSGHLGGAGLDVWEQEPPPAAHPLLTLPNVVASPHLAGVTEESRANVGRMAGEALVAACRHEPLPRVINPECLGNLQGRWRQLGSPLELDAASHA